MLIEVGNTVTLTLVMLGTGFTVRTALPDFVASSVDVAVMVAVPLAVEAGVNSPAAEIVPMPDGLTAHVTPVLKAPVPVTVAVACAVCAVVIGFGVTETETAVMVGGGAFTVTCALPETLGSATEVAVRVAVPVVAGVKTPAPVIVPMLDGLTLHVTALL